MSELARWPQKDLDDLAQHLPAEGLCSVHQWSTMSELGEVLPILGQRLTTDGMPKEIAGEVAEMIRPIDRQCSICREVFTEPEYARRCEAQGPPPMPYHVGDLLMRSRAKYLTLITFTRVHHALGVICPINGPCEHDRVYAGSRLYPTLFGNSPAWLASCEVATPVRPASIGFVASVTIPAPYEVKVMTYARLSGLTQPWGVVPEDGDPELYMIGPYVGEDWQKLWELYYKWTARRQASGFQKRLPGLRVAKCTI